MEERATPSTFIVLNLEDTGPNSLRQAILDAQASNAEPDTINFAISGTITLQSSLPNIDFANTKGTLSIIGPDPSSVIISGDNGISNRDFNIFNIFPSGNLSITGITVSGANCFSQSGGAFNNLGNLSISNSTISGNFVKNSAGGIYNSGTLTITNSTIAGNTSKEALGGGIFNQSSSTLTVINCTLSGNAAFEGGGIYNRGTLNIANTILADSTKPLPDKTKIDDFSGPGTVNLIGSSTKANNLVTKGNFSFATTKTSAEIDLQSLDNNGGGTFTMALGASSAAIGTGNAGISNVDPVNGVDQRGFIRSPTMPSIGAFEFNGISPAPTVTSVSPSSGPALGGTVITITGTNFTGASLVSIGNNFASFTVENSTTITATVPTTNIGPGSVLVTTAHGTNAANTLFTGIGPANTPAFGTATSTADGFTVQISNYHKFYTYAGTATAGGTVAISGTGLVTVTGVGPNTSTTATITTTRTNFASGSSQVTASSLNAVNTPTFDTPAPTADGFTVQISNYDGAFMYAASATANGAVAISGTGLVTVTGVAPNTSSTATITTTRANFVSGAASVAATSLNGANTPTFGTPTSTANGFTVQISNYDGAFTYAGTATAGGTVAISGTGLVTVTGVAPNTSSIATITTTRANFVSGTASVSGTSLAPPTVASISPDSGLFTGGTPITISGANFTGASAVTIGGASATNFTVVNSTTIAAITPAGTVGKASVLVTTPVGTNASNNLFTYETAITVTTTADSVNSGDGVTSLREAITLANSTPANDQINFNLTGASPYTITLGSALPEIKSASTAGTLVINGLGAFVLTISGSDPTNPNNATRDFRILSIKAGGDLTLSGVTVSGAQNFNFGGAIDNDGTLTIANSILAGNSSIGNSSGTTVGLGGGIFNSGTLFVSNSTFFGNAATGRDSPGSEPPNLTVNGGEGSGGGIFNSGTLTVSNSTFSGNAATGGFGGPTALGANVGRGGHASGGAIRNDGTLTIANSTFFGNAATGGFGLGQGGNASGGAIDNTGTLTIVNSTCSGNAATGGTTILSLTGDNNHNGNSAGGGINNTATLNISNTILANSISGGDFAGTAPSIISNNLVEDGSLAGALFGDPLLGALQYNGGLTFTMALGVGSPAAIGGDSTISNASPIFGLDQRGLTRSSSLPSIGACEFNAGTPGTPTVTSVNPVSGPIEGGTSVTINGNNLAGVFGVTFDSGVATHVTVVSDTSINVTTPAGVAGSASVLVATLGGGISAANSLFTYGNPANTPTFGTPTPTANGFTVQISNFDGAFTYAGTATANGTVGISGTGLVTVTGVAPNISSTVTITTTRTNFPTGSSQVTGTSLNAANTPTFGTPTPTANGFTVQISNFDGAFTYAGTATASGTVGISGTGLVTVTGVGPNTSSTSTITTTRTNFVSGSATVAATSLNAANTPTFGTPTPTANGFTVQISNFDGAFTYAGTATANGAVAISGTGLVTVTGVAPNSSSSATITTTRTNFVSGSASVAATSLNAANTPAFGTPTPTANGYTVQISNFDGAFTYAGTATAGGTVAISGTGLVTVTGVAPKTSSTATITTTRTNFVNGSATVAATSLARTAPLVTGTPASTSGGSSTVTLFDQNTGEAKGTVEPFPGFKGPVKVASGDFNQDGKAEIVAAAGFGGGPAVAILDSETGVVRATFFAYSQDFQGGVFAAVRDVNNDGFADIITGAGPGGGPHVKVFDGKNLQEMASFFAYSQAFKGGVSVASADINGDNVLDIVTGAGPGGGPHVKVFDGASKNLIKEWFAYPANFTGGVFVAVGDIGNDGKFEVVTGAGMGGGPVVAVFNPFNGALQDQFFAYAPSFTGGVRVGINDADGDSVPDLVTGAGPGGAPHVKGFNYPKLDLLFEFFSGPVDNNGGVFLS